MMRLNFFIIPMVTILVVGFGSVITESGLEWYQTLTLPIVTPPAWLFAVIWTMIYILAALAALIISNLPRRRPELPIGAFHFWLVMTLFGLNAILNVLWTYLFFSEHLLGGAMITASVLFFTLALLVGLIWSSSKRAVVLLAPYGVWLLFATYLSYEIWRLNS